MDFIDLHCHYLPAVDDGVRSLEESIKLLKALKSIGYKKVVCTPHIRTGMFDNNPTTLRAAFERFVAETELVDGLPELGLAAEHYYDDVFWEMFLEDKLLRYPGDKAALVEFNPARPPLNVENQFFKMKVHGLSPVLAHPERYEQSQHDLGWLERYTELGVLLQLDLMSLVGKYGRHAKHAAKKLLDGGLYTIACSDCHRPEHVPFVKEAIEHLISQVGEKPAFKLLSEGPKRVLDDAGEAG
ncbi:MAG: protein tyrosine phosphatase [Myxococcales bacterium]|nr:MAG: protein tyrosine phosphatase [Myxococcales bacterium]